MTSTFRYYQQEANVAICNELLTNDKCLVKMFCGTGKSLLMRKCGIIDAAQLVVYVFPSLSLIDQFYMDYLHDFPSEDILKISSELEATTDSVKITCFLSKQINKIVCVTYHSYGTLLENLGLVKINVCMFDEAHNTVGETYKKLIFENDLCEKQIFFTATPKNDNGIVMYDREHLDDSICGKLVYDYSYLRGVVEGYLNPIEIRVDMYTENTNKSVYASIARAILTTGNNRCLTFHSDVNADRDTSVNNFVDDAEFKRTFKEIQKKEFPSETKYKKIKMIAMSSESNAEDRRKLLTELAKTSDNEIMVISSCAVIKEGIDTKTANMCVFVDPKSSYVQIIQNVGRIVRKVFGVDKPNSTILIPCWVDKTKYLECDGDRVKCDAVIRQDMSEGGNFNGILNVLSALKQEDEELYDICLNYPSCFSPHEIRSNWLKQGYKTLDPIGDGSLFENIRFVLDAEIDYDEYADCDSDEEIIRRIAEDNDVCVEIHTTSLENPIEFYNQDCEGGEIIRLYRNDEADEDYDDDNDVIGTRYQPIVKISGEKKSKNNLSPPNRENRMRVNVHTNPDVQVLWNITSDIDITKEICSCVINCEIITYDPMEVAVDIVERANARNLAGGRLLPRRLAETKCITDELIRENKDANKFGMWRKALKGRPGCKCSNEVRDYLDNNMPGWRTEIDFDKKAMDDAVQIVNRANARELIGGRLLPRCNIKLTTDAPEELKQESKDAKKLGRWKDKGSSRCSDEVRDYLDKNLLDWRTKLDFDKKAMEDAKCIFERAKARALIGERLLPRSGLKPTTPELKQESKDAKKLGHLKDRCPNEVIVYLDKNLPGWRDDLDTKAIEYAKQIVKRANERKKNKQNVIPRRIQKKDRNTKELEQEHNDATKCAYWKKILFDKASGRCCDAVRDILDKGLPGWSNKVDLDKNAKEAAEQIVERAEERNKAGGVLIPRLLKKILQTSPELIQESKDASKLQNCKKALKNGIGSGNKCCDAVRDYYDKNLPGWRSIDATVDADTPQPKPKKIIKKKLIIIEKSPAEDTPQPTPKKSMKLNVPPTSQPVETTEHKRKRVKSELSVLHQRYKSLTSQNLRKEFTENPDLWAKYHEISEENEKSFPEDGIPRNRIIAELNKIQTKRTKSVVDMGCGKAQIAQHFTNDHRFQFINYDHISSSDAVTSCDISRTPLDDNSVEICVLSLAMWGHNCKEYITEASRILESNGELYIIEPTKRWTEKDEHKNIIPGKEGDELKKLLETNGFHVKKPDVEKFCLFVCTKSV